MDWGLFWQAAGVGVAVLGIVAGGFYWLWGQITRVRDDAEKGVAEVRKEAAHDVAAVRSEAALRTEAAHILASATKEELHQHRLHVAETYITRASMREVMEPVLEAISGVRDQITGMSGRIDRLMERPPARRTTGQS